MRALNVNSALSQLDYTVGKLQVHNELEAVGKEDMNYINTIMKNLSSAIPLGESSEYQFCFSASYTARKLQFHKELEALRKKT